jgi:anaerobic ribonucleoside-triphosphate reductase activating protein
MMNHSLIASIAQIVPDTEAEGPGRRFAVWFQGCPLRCPGCCNPEFLPFRGGSERLVRVVIEEMTATPGIEGISLLGGEPFAHIPASTVMARAARDRGLSVMVYSGYTLDELKRMPDASHVLAHTDVLVDGPYDRARPEPTRRWVGSANQGVHFLTDRYSPDDPCWTKRNTLELRVRGTEVSVNGFPAVDAKGLWKGWTRKAVSRG